MATVWPGVEGQRWPLPASGRRGGRYRRDKRRVWRSGQGLLEPQRWQQREGGRSSSLRQRERGRWRALERWRLESLVGGLRKGGKKQTTLRRLTESAQLLRQRGFGDPWGARLRAVAKVAPAVEIRRIKKGSQVVGVPKARAPWRRWGRGVKLFKSWLQRAPRPGSRARAVGVRRVLRERGWLWQQRVKGVKEVLGYRAGLSGNSRPATTEAVGRWSRRQRRG